MMTSWCRVYLKLLNSSLIGFQEGPSLTVCVAAICNNENIVGAADRMLTAGDVEFEPPQTKVLAVTSSIALMIAGDASLQIEIIHVLQARVAEQIRSTPDEWIKVRTVADCYYRYFQGYFVYLLWD